MGVYERALWPLLRRLDAETSHSLSIALLDGLQAIPAVDWAIERLLSFQDPRLRFTWRGLTFRNPVGLAAGVDKNARLPRILRALGLGFIEVGTVTPMPQPGNPRPRVARLTSHHALVNRLGFPSHGMQRVARNVKRLRLKQTPLGMNIGKNAATPLAQATDDYLSCLRSLYSHGDYFVINVSSPNTEGLTSLQAATTLSALARAVIGEAQALAETRGQPRKPVLAKVSPDLSKDGLHAAIDASLEAGLDGLVAVNTSINQGLRTSAGATIPGGISGEPLRERAVEAVSLVRDQAPSDFFVLGVGGVFKASHAWDLLRAGANAVQMYTGLVYQGPGVIGEINRGLVRLMDQEGVGTIAEVTGGTKAKP
jgi:dihydroorotate dehydrogenase